MRLTNLQSLDQRREIISLRFVKNSLKNANFSKLFPLKKVDHVMRVRNPLKYYINKARTERYNKSTIPYLQRLLNKESFKRKAELNDLKTFNHAEKKRRTQLKYKDRLPMQVNYVGYANPIT